MLLRTNKNVTNYWFTRMDFRTPGNDFHIYDLYKTKGGNHFHKHGGPGWAAIGIRLPLYSLVLAL